jgi:hypothetical protein
MSGSLVIPGMNLLGKLRCVKGIKNVNRIFTLYAMRFFNMADRLDVIVNWLIYPIKDENFTLGMPIGSDSPGGNSKPAYERRGQSARVWVQTLTASATHGKPAITSDFALPWVEPADECRRSG